MANTPELNAQDRMDKILSLFPGARRALFASFHIGGCQSCAYRDEETLTEVCERNNLALDDVVMCLQESHRHDLDMLISPQELKRQLSSGSLILLDLRTREEHEAVVIPNSEFLTQERQNELFASPLEIMIVLYDHTGRDVLDRCSWFRGHGLKNTFALQGGIDAWSREVDSSLPRYRLELES